MRVNVLVRINQGPINCYLVLWDYILDQGGITAKLLDAVFEQLKKKHGDRAWKFFDGIEILGEV